jgi:hypothetical protein
MSSRWYFPFVFSNNSMFQFTFAQIRVMWSILLIDLAPVS